MKRKILKRTSLIPIFALFSLLAYSPTTRGETVVTALHENGDHFTSLPGFQNFSGTVNPDGSTDVVSVPFSSGVTTPLFSVPGAVENGRVDYTDVVLHISPDQALITLNSTITVCKCSTPASGCSSTCGGNPGDSLITVHHALYQANSLADVTGPDPSHPNATPFIWVMTKHDSPTEVTGEFLGQAVNQLDYRCFSDVDFSNPIPFVFQHGSTYVISTSN